MRKGRLLNVILILIFLAGLSLLLYPTVSNYWNSFHQSKMIAQYAEQVANMDREEYERLWAEASAYNESLAEQNKSHSMSAIFHEEYNNLLNVSGLGMMGYIEIPRIKCSLPIYHGTEESVLQIAIGHMEGTSLPIGGVGTHCVLSGHRGLPSAKLFTHLDQLEEGDIFMLRILDEELTYEVDRILIVEPQETGALQIKEGKDYCTLVTCTPYGINSHRLLVRGHRVENQESTGHLRVTADAMRIEPILIAPIVAVPILLVLLIVFLAKTRRKK